MRVATVSAASIAKNVAPKIQSASPATMVPLIVLITRARKLRFARSSAGSVTTISEIIAQYGWTMPNVRRPYQTMSEPVSSLTM